MTSAGCRVALVTWDPKIGASSVHHNLEILSRSADANCGEILTVVPWQFQTVLHLDMLLVIEHDLAILVSQSTRLMDETCTILTERCFREL